ncbi:MAG: cell cycle transcriptional regulator TrcR, partial [Pseudomonadota bacterium]
KRMTKILMPKATAVWLIENTGLTFDQIANFTSLHILEVQALADGESNVLPLDPIQGGVLSTDEIKRCETDPAQTLTAIISDLPDQTPRRRGPRYTPVTKRADKPDGIAWLIKHQKFLSDSQIIRLVGTTKNTINAIRERTHWNISNLQPRNPVELGLCRYHELQEEIAIAHKKHGIDQNAQADSDQTEQSKSEIQTETAEKTLNLLSEKQD